MWEIIHWGMAKQLKIFGLPGDIEEVNFIEDLMRDVHSLDLVFNQDL